MVAHLGRPAVVPVRLLELSSQAAQFGTLVVRHADQRVVPARQVVACGIRLPPGGGPVAAHLRHLDALGYDEAWFGEHHSGGPADQSDERRADAVQNGEHIRR